jgi:putative PIN family toxin of toxin-antitoxin system
VIRAVLDSNVLASGAAGRAVAASIPGEIVRSWRARRFEMVVSAFIIDEVRRVLDKRYFRRTIPAGEAAEFLALIGRMNLVTPAPHVRGVVSDPDDDLVLGTTVAAGAEYLVTGDDALLALRSFEGVSIVTPRDFVLILERE